MKNTVTVDASIQIDTGEIPSFVSKNIAQSVFQAIHSAWENPQTKEDYARWLTARNERTKSSNKH